MADSISAFVRGSVFLPNLPPIPIGTLNWFQAWDNSGKGVFVFSLWMTFRGAYIELFLQRSILRSSWPNPTTLA